MADGRTILRGLERNLAGPLSVILRPEDLAFQVDPAGQAVIVRCELSMGGWMIYADSAGQKAMFLSDHPCSPGVRGWLSRKAAREIVH
jgi:hypothetical protein